MNPKYLSYCVILFTICSISLAGSEFRNTEIMTARGFGKRDNNANLEAHLLDRLIGITDTKRNPYMGEPRLRFRLDGGEGLRIGRGFGKRSPGPGQKEEYTRPWSSPSIKDLNDAEAFLQQLFAANGSPNESQESVR